MKKNARILKGGKIIRIHTHGVIPPYLREIIIEKGGRQYSVKVEAGNIMKYEAIE